MRALLLGRASTIGFVLGSVVTCVGACSAASGGSKVNGTGGSSASGGSGGFGATGGMGATGGFGAVGGSFDGGGGSGGFTGDPKTCAQATAAKSYIGCDFWPTVTANNVWSIFDYAVIVANAGDTDATVTIEKNGQSISDTVPANGLKKFYLPWIPELKGPDTNTCGAATPMSASVRATGGAYHLTSTVPVTVYQFNALEYKPAGGQSGKNWGACPGNQPCSQNLGAPIGCFSYSNDASILLPTPVLTGNYRITAQKGWPAAGIGPYFAITGTQDGTSVTVNVSSTGQILGGGGVQATGGGGTATFTINAGEVVEIVGSASSDPSGSLVRADKPVQVITGMPCAQAPVGTQACDHIEETVFPAETLGAHYFVVPPTGPLDNVPGHLVRIYGNVDGTQLTYPSGQPNGAPTTINAGQVVDLNNVKQPFEIQGDHEFAVGSFMLGGQILDPSGGKGDPSQSMAIPVEQFRSKYVFLAPDDYDISYVDIVMPDGTNVTLDGSAVPPPQPLGSGYSLARVKLGSGAQGAHLLSATQPVGIQVMGYGSYTSYQYPGGANLEAIAPPPPK